jgi:hypothetical protein
MRTTLDHFIHLIWSTFSCLLLVKAAGALAYHWREKAANSSPPFLMIIYPTLHGVCKTPSTSQSTFVNE